MAFTKGQTAWNKGLPAPWARNNHQTFKKGHKTWNEGKHIYLGGKRIEKGQHLSPKTEFKNETTAGEKNVNWKGGITPINEKIRKTNEYRIWRIAVFERDNYTCQTCGQVGGKLHADHIKPFSLFPELRFAIDNGRTLCIECHKQTDTYLNKMNNYKKGAYLIG